MEALEWEPRSAECQRRSGLFACYQTPRSITPQVVQLKSDAHSGGTTKKNLQDFVRTEIIQGIRNESAQGCWCPGLHLWKNKDSLLSNYM